MSAQAKQPGHTPGPWSCTDDRRGIWDIFHEGDLLAQVWRVRPGVDGDLPAEANARLMAAAPKLLAACKKAVARLKFALSIRIKLTGFDGGKLAEEIAEIDAAIAQAEGHS